MAIQMRRGLRKDFDPYKMLPGEWAASIDKSTHNQIVWMCFEPGIVKRMGTYEDFKAQIAEATDDIRKEYEQTFNEIKEYMEGLAEESEENKNVSKEKAKEAFASADSASKKALEAETYASTAGSKATESENYAKQAQSYAVGTGGARPNESIDSAKYYYEQLKDVSEKLSGTLRPQGTVAFVSLPSLKNVQEGWMYNVSDRFTTNANFKEGSGHVIPAGSNVYKTADGFWDILAGTPVSSVNGQTGDVSITPENIGALQGNGTAAAATKLATARTIFGQSFDGTGNVVGRGSFFGRYNDNASGRFSTSALEIRENGVVGNTQTDIAYAPSIGFHWSSICGGTLALGSDTKFYFLNQFGEMATLITKLEGNASSATKATQDGNGNVIADTYVKKSDVPLIQSGAVRVELNSENTSLRQHVDFPTRYSKVPAVTVNVSDKPTTSSYNNIKVFAVDKTISGFVVLLTGDKTGLYTIDWIAV